MIRLIYSLTYLNARSAWLKRGWAGCLDGLAAVGVLHRTGDDTGVQPFGCLAFHLRFGCGSHGGNPARGEFLRVETGQREKERERRKLSR